jgi:hypothetical protein
MREAAGRVPIHERGDRGLVHLGREATREIGHVERAHRTDRGAAERQGGG